MDKIFWVWWALLPLLAAGCSTTVKYTPNPAVVAGPPKPAGYPMPVYTRDMKIPRPTQVIGTISIGGSELTVFGRSAQNEMRTIMQKAYDKGADVVRMTVMDEPGFSNPSYHMAAELLRYADTWENIAITEAQFQAYLHANPAAVDPIEGVWVRRGFPGNRLGIIRNTSMPGRDFVAFVLGTTCPSWRRGYKKMDIARGPQPGAYDLVYYLDDFTPQRTSILLKGQRTFTLDLQVEDEGRLVTYDKQ